MSKYIDKDELWERLQKRMVHHVVTNTLFNTIKAVIDGMPTIDIVHCKDCKAHYDVDKNPAHIMCGYMSDNDYCSYGERRADESKSDD